MRAEAKSFCPKNLDGITEQGAYKQFIAAYKHFLTKCKYLNLDNHPNLIQKKLKKLKKDKFGYNFFEYAKN